MMDPNEALKNAREAVARYETARLVDRETATYAADDLADAFEALDGWLAKGGFLPSDWAAGR